MTCSPRQDLELQQLDTQVGILTKQYAHIAADYKALAALFGAGLNRIQEAIQRREQAQEWNVPSR